jgi:hypothetical protein
MTTEQAPWDSFAPGEAVSAAPAQTAPVAAPTAAGGSLPRMVAFLPVLTCSRCSAQHVYGGGHDCLQAMQTARAVMLCQTIMGGIRR